MYKGNTPYSKILIYFSEFILPYVIRKRVNSFDEKRHRVLFVFDFFKV